MSIHLYMLSLISFLRENLIVPILEEAPFFYQRKVEGKFNYKLTSHGHAAERDRERQITTEEVKSLVKSCWSKIKKGIEDGKILINKKDSKQSGSSVALHCSDKTRSGYLVVIIFPVKYHKNSDYYEIEVVTTWKGKTLDSYKEPFKDKDGKEKCMHHPEYGQLDIWDNVAIEHYDKKDVWTV